LISTRFQASVSFKRLFLYRLAEVTSLAAAANLLTFRAMPDGLPCPGPGQGCSVLIGDEGAAFAAGRAPTVGEGR